MGGTAAKWSSVSPPGFRLPPETRRATAQPATWAPVRSSQMAIHLTERA